MRRLLPLLFVLALASRAAADEEESTQTPVPSPTPAVGFSGGGSKTEGDERWMRELLDEPEKARWSALFTVPVREKRWTGLVSARMASTQEGAFRVEGDGAKGAHFTARAFRDRRPLDFRTFAPREAASGIDLETAREHASLDVGAPLARSGASWTFRVNHDRRGGTWPSVSGGRIATLPSDTWNFGTPSWSTGETQITGARALVKMPVSGVGLTVDAGARMEANRDTLRSREETPAGEQIGTFAISDGDRRVHVDAGVTGEVSPSPSLHAGASYRIGGFRGDPRTWRRVVGGAEHESADVDIEGITHHAAAGATFLPLPSVRTGIRARAMADRRTAVSTENRRAATLQLARGRSTRDTWSAAVDADADFSPIRRVRLEARAGGELWSMSDRYRQTFTLPGTTTPLASRLEDVVRDRESGHAELAARVTPLARTHIRAGARMDTDRFGVDEREAEDTQTLGDRRRSRTTIFGDVRTRPIPRVGLDAQVAAFREDSHVRGTDPSRTGLDVRGRAVGSVRAVSLFALGGWTEDRYRLDPDRDLAGAAPLEFDGASWFAGTGVAGSLGRARASATFTHTASVRDVEHVLQDALLDVSAPIGRLTGGVAIRWTHFRETTGARREGDAAAAFATVGGSF